MDISTKQQEVKNIEPKPIEQRTQPPKEQADDESFQSISSRGQLQQNQQKQIEKNYILKPLEFPSASPTTQTLLQMYQKNTSLINSLKQQISRLSFIKRQNIFIKNDSVKIKFEEEESEFFLTAQQLYKQRQSQLQKLKNQIRTVDREQLTTLMSKNPNVIYLSNAYFEKFKTIIDAKIYGQNLFLLTEQKKKVHVKRKKNNLQNEVEKLTNVRHQSAKKNQKSQELINTNGEASHFTHQKEKGSKISTPKKSQQQRHICFKNIYKIRKVNLSHLFSEYQQKKLDMTGSVFDLVLPKSQLTPKTFVYDEQNGLFLISFCQNLIQGYYLPDESCEYLKQQHSSSHKSNNESNVKLKGIENLKIEIDKNVRVLYLELFKSFVYLLTSDGVLRIYQVIYGLSNKQARVQIKDIIYCLNSEQPIGQIQHMIQNYINPNQLLFTTSSNLLCKIDISKYKTQIIHKFNQKILSFDPNYLETQNYLYLNLIENSQKNQLKPLSKEKVKPLNSENQKNTLKKCTFVQDGTIYFIKINTHGLLQGFIQNF